MPLSFSFAFASRSVRASLARLAAATLAVTAAGLLTAACSSKSEGETAFTDATLLAACTRSTDVGAARAARCGSGYTFPPDQRDDEIRTCVEYQKLPGLGTTVESFERCTKAIETEPCDSTLEACKQDKPTLVVGQACNFYTQCMSWFCEYGSRVVDQGDGTSSPTSTSCGICAERLPVGAACTTGSPCATGTKCVAGTCQTGKAEGAACTGLASSRDECASPLRCIEGVCRKARKQGEACKESGECGTWDACVAYGSSAVCAPRKWVSVGDACDYGTSQCDGGCYGPVDDAGDPTGERTCHAPIPDGQPCDENSQTDTCSSYSQCLNSVCTSYYVACK